MSTKLTPDQRFLRFLRHEGECWVWLGAIIHGDHGMFGLNGKIVRAREYAWNKHRPDEPTPRRFRRGCDTPRCVNPFHMQDAAIPPAPEGITRVCACGCGQNTPLAKVTQRSRGHMAGYPMKYIQGHGNRSQGSFMDRFMTRVDIDENGGCWNWTGQHGSDGRPRMYYKGHTRLAYRAIFEETYGFKPARVRKACSNTNCVNPKHLIGEM